MDIVLRESAQDQEIIDALHQCGLDDAVCCNSEHDFKQAKTLLLKEKLKNVTIQLLDDDGYAIKQVTSKPKDPRIAREQLNGRQVAVVKALEKVLRHCKKEGVQLVGYSDELVALPAHIPVEEISNAGAMNVESFDVYKGADAIAPSSEI